MLTLGVDTCGHVVGETDGDDFRMFCSSIPDVYSNIYLRSSGCQGEQSRSAMYPYYEKWKLSRDKRSVPG